MQSLFGQSRVALVAAVLLTLGSAANAPAALITFSTAGPNAAAILPTVNSFQAALGALNPNVPGPLPPGRREINWDGVPDNLAAPNNLPANFFNVTSPRGVVFSTPGTGFQVSADASNPTATPVRFGNIDPTYTTSFTTFSPERLFTALGSNITDVNFFVPGTNVPALTRGFGAVFTDVDIANTTSIEFFDASNNSLGTLLAPSAPGNGNLSFIGGIFTQGNVVSRVRITSGNAALGAGVIDGGPTDLVVMDDFIYGEPVPNPNGVNNVPLPPALWMGLLTAAAPAVLARRRLQRR